MGCVGLVMLLVLVVVRAVLGGTHMFLLSCVIRCGLVAGCVVARMASGPERWLTSRCGFDIGVGVGCWLERCLLLSWLLSA